MEHDSPFQNAAHTSLGFESMFKHPEGLLTARNLVRLLMAHKMEEDKKPRSFPGSQQTLMRSFHVSRTIQNFTPTMPDTLKQVLTFEEPQTKNRKRKSDAQQEPTKKPRLDKPAKAKRPPKPKAPKKELAKYQLDHAVWMRILEFTPPQFLGKARLICKEFRSMVDDFTSIYVNCRKENYGNDMPPPPLGLTERQYSNLLGTKGCLEPGCPDKGASRTHWSWAKRWCVNCWRSKIEREDRLIKNRADRMGNRNTFMKLLECIPVGMHDSFMKPHDYVDVDDNRPRGAPRLYKYYLKSEVEKIIERYEALTPEPYRPDTNRTAEENAASLASYQEEMSKLEEKRTNWLSAEKAKIDEHMALVRRIEAGVRHRRENHRTPYDKNRNARKELFTRRAKEDLPHIEEDFIKNSPAFKAATRVFRDGGTERGWQTLKPKIEKEWASKWRNKETDAPSNDSSQMDGAADDWQLAPDALMSDDVELDFDIDANNSPVDLLSSYTTRHSCNQAEANWNLYALPLGSIHSDPTSKSARSPPRQCLQNGAGGSYGVGGSGSSGGFAGMNTSHTKHLQNATGTNGIGGSGFNSMFAGVNNSQTKHCHHNNAGFGHLQRQVPTDNRSVTQWPYSMRALPPPSYIASPATPVSHNYTSYTTHSSTLNTGPLFPGVIPTSAPPSTITARSSHISISSLVHKFDQ
ncbi:hypothetical protein D0Z07_8851 [Hyphodiscus hymeniophilus]|uniref:F-box domain-containing protein n=1 Tax=Hyphodiscus hymeniophilus TaxID=353542 RepID=A0A9P6SKS5_9HELO|nr:hypothetical protein D0Z07_8851 [Hyphodiscus hymeniophilus]